MQCLVHVINVCRTSSGCIKDMWECVCVCLLERLLRSVHNLWNRMRGNESVKSTITHNQVFSTYNWLYETLNVNVQWEVYKSHRAGLCRLCDKRANCGPTAAQERCGICQWSFAVCSSTGGNLHRHWLIICSRGLFGSFVSSCLHLFMNAYLNSERGKEGERRAWSLLSRQRGWIVTFSVSTIFHIFNRALSIFFSSSGGWDGLCSIRRACVFVCTVCVFVLNAWERERERENQCREGSRGWGV